MLKENTVSKDISEGYQNKGLRPSTSKIIPITLTVMVLLSMGFSWLMMKQVEQSKLLVERLNILEKFNSSVDHDSSETRDDVNELLDTRLETVDEVLERIELYQTRTDQTLSLLRKMVESNKLALSDFSASRTYLLSLSEVAHSLRVANERLSILGDVSSAKAILINTDKILLRLDRAELDSARQSIAKDLARLRAQGNIDIQGFLGRIESLIGLIDDLKIPALPNISAHSTSNQEFKSEKNSSSFSFAAELEKLSEFITIRKSDKKYKTLFDPQFEALIRKNIKILLRQAQIAVLSRDSVLFETALEQVDVLVGEFQFASNETFLKIKKEIEAMDKKGFSPSQLDLSVSVEAIDRVIRRNLAKEKD